MNSMTGFGRGTCLKDGREITIELRSVNHKFLDLSFRMPRTFSFLEESLRTCIAARLSRGRIDVALTYKNMRDDAKTVQIDKAIMAQYLNAGNEIAEEYNLRNDLSVLNLIRLPEVITVAENEDDAEAIQAIAAEALSTALDSLITMRKNEGEHLKADINAKLDTLSAIRNTLEKRADSAMQEHKTRLEERIAALMQQDIEVDSARLATEIAIMADKASVDEELVRIKTHISSMRVMLESEEPVGRKLDFLVQELNREFNTTGSKSADVEIAQNVIAGKAEIEKIREQIQNIE